ncbi:MAG: GFA family protein [Rhodobacteraceae bacterium]|nr:GFA family protein [Paracoccaceae bacterium]
MKGSCLCGAVAFEVDKIPESYRACHCNACRKSGGHYWSAFSVANDDFRFTEDRGLKWYRSSDWAERGFCKECGLQGRLLRTRGRASATTGLGRKTWQIFRQQRGL